MAASSSPCSPPPASWRSQRASRHRDRHAHLRRTALPSRRSRPVRPYHHRAGSPRRAASGAPRLYVVPSMLLSAFSVGSSQRFAIAVTEGLLRRLTMREVAAVLAREVAHAQRGDLLVLGIAEWISRFAQAALLRGFGAGGAQHPAGHFRWRSSILAQRRSADPGAGADDATAARTVVGAGDRCRPGGGTADRRFARRCVGRVTPRPFTRLAPRRSHASGARAQGAAPVDAALSTPRPLGASRGSTPSRRRPCRRSTSPRARAFR